MKEERKMGRKGQKVKGEGIKETHHTRIKKKKLIKVEGEIREEEESQQRQNRVIMKVGEIKGRERKGKREQDAPYQRKTNTFN